MIAVGTTGPQQQVPDRSGRCRTSTASAGSQWALPDLNSKRQIAVGSAGPRGQHRTSTHNTLQSHKHTIHNTNDLMSRWGSLEVKSFRWSRHAAASATCQCCNECELRAQPLCFSWLNSVSCIDASYRCSPMDPKAALHIRGDCIPCRYLRRPGGCERGDECRFCHLCTETLGLQFQTRLMGLKYINLHWGVRGQWANIP